MSRGPVPGGNAVLPHPNQFAVAPAVDERLIRAQIERDDGAILGHEDRVGTGVLLVRMRARTLVLQSLDQLGDGTGGIQGDDSHDAVAVARRDGAALGDRERAGEVALARHDPIDLETLVGAAQRDDLSGHLEGRVHVIAVEHDPAG